LKRSGCGRESAEYRILCDKQRELTRAAYAWEMEQADKARSRAQKQGDMEAAWRANDEMIRWAQQWDAYEEMLTSS